MAKYRRGREEEEQERLAMEARIAEEIRNEKAQQWLALAPERGGIKTLFTQEIREDMASIQLEGGWTNRERLEFLQGRAYQEGWPEEVRRMLTITMIRAVQGEINLKAKEERLEQWKRLPRNIRLTKDEFAKAEVRHDAEGQI